MFCRVATTRGIRSVIASFPGVRNRFGTEGITVTSSMTEKSPIVGHDKAKSEFYVRLQGEKPTSTKALLQYSVHRPGVLDLYHTEVPVEFRGQGVAKLLAKAALDYVVDQDAKMILSCSYLQKYAQDNPYPQYTDRIVNG